MTTALSDVTIENFVRPKSLIIIVPEAEIVDALLVPVPVVDLVHPGDDGSHPALSSPSSPYIWNNAALPPLSIVAKECPRKGPCPWQCGYLPPGARCASGDGGTDTEPGSWWHKTRPAPEMGQSVIYCHNLTSQITAPTDNLWQNLISTFLCVS